ncbi:flagellin [Insolitispirillum peregrinum]|uniref:Flagellin n=1 Tax=Insolitispirillum peregrinum TaxID=80876 RepID=A0A1N7IN36_9PROT|nr:flagellin [Insolitispirillum peregrinum]SIS38480.1 Flagellin FlgL [Insolitispirillum peregrinum]
MAGDITLSTSTRSNLLSLQSTTNLIDRTQDRLSSGKKVNSALDDALSFFKSRSLNDRASDLATVKDGISEGINVIKAAVGGLESIESTLKQMKAIASSAKSSTDSVTRQKLSSQYNELRSQIDNLTEDSSYNGVNLIKSSADTLTVKFNEQSSATLKNELVINGVDSSAATLGVSAVTSATWGATSGFVASIDTEISKIDSALNSVRNTAQTLGTNSSMLSIRQDFTTNIINTLKGGAGELVNADLNEESANMLALQTRQSLGTISLSIAQQSQQSVLRLF